MLSGVFPAFMQPNAFGPAVEAADQAFHSATFWYVLAVLLGGGCVYYLFRWLYERELLAQQQDLSRLYHLAESILESGDVEAFQKDVVEICRTTAGATHCFLLLLNRSAKQLDYVAGTGTPPLASVSLSAISGAVTCFRSQALTEVPDADNSPFLKAEVVRRLGRKSLLYVPIMAGGACLGVIEVEDRGRKRVFTKQQKAGLQHVGRLVALSLRLGDQRSVQAHLRRTEKMATVVELVEGVAETLVSPLRRVDELAEAHAEEYPPGVADRLREASREARRAMATVERLVHLTSARGSALQQVDVHALLESVRDRWTEEGHKLTLSLSRAAARVSADPNHLEQILWELLQHGERMLEGLEGRSLQLSTNLLEHTVVISIGPAGSSDAAGEDSKIVGEQRMVEAESSLRLAICQNLVEGFGGTLRVENRRRRGFRIEMRYPLAAETLPRKKPATSPATGVRYSSPEATTVLVIDPDTRVQDALLYLLSERGNRVVLVSTAEEGIDLCTQAHFDWVFCDERTSDTGGTYEQIRPRAHRFIFLSDGLSGLHGGFPEGSHNAVLRKPVIPEELDRLLSSWEVSAEESHEDKQEQHTTS